MWVFLAPVEVPAASITSGGNAAFAYTETHGDLIGSFASTGTALASSTSYDPWGQLVASTGITNDLGYQGGWTDPTKGTPARDCDGASADPIRFTTSIPEPLSPVADAWGASHGLPHGPFEGVRPYLMGCRAHRFERPSP